MTSCKGFVIAWSLLALICVCLGAPAGLYAPAESPSTTHARRRPQASIIRPSSHFSIAHHPWTSLDDSRENAEAISEQEDDNVDIENPAPTILRSNRKLNGNIFVDFGFHGHSHTPVLRDVSTDVITTSEVDSEDSEVESTSEGPRRILPASEVQKLWQRNRLFQSINKRMMATMLHDVDDDEESSGKSLRNTLDKPILTVDDNKENDDDLISKLLSTRNQQMEEVIADLSELDPALTMPVVDPQRAIPSRFEASTADEVAVARLRQFSTLEPHLGPAIVPLLVPEGYFVPFLPRQAFGVVQGSVRPPHGHASFYQHRPPGLTEVANTPAYGFSYGPHRRFKPS